MKLASKLLLSESSIMPCNSVSFRTKFENRRKEDWFRREDEEAERAQGEKSRLEGVKRRTKLINKLSLSFRLCIQFFWRRDQKENICTLLFS